MLTNVIKRDIIITLITKGANIITDKLMECFTNPVKSRMLLEIYKNKKETAKQLKEICSDVSQATLYRYLDSMVKEGILKISSETKIRGAVQKTYAVNIDFEKEGAKFSEKADAETVLQMFMQYMAGLLKEFQSFAENENSDIKKDPFSFTVCPLYLNTEEIKNLISDVSRLLSPLMKNTADGERQLHSFGLVLTPPKKQK